MSYLTQLKDYDAWTDCYLPDGNLAEFSDKQDALNFMSEQENKYPMQEYRVVDPSELYLITYTGSACEISRDYETTKIEAKDDFMDFLGGLYANGGGYVRLFGPDSDETLIGWIEHPEGGFAFGTLAEDCDWIFDCDDEDCYNSSEGDIDEVYCLQCQKKALEWAFGQLEK